jgi:hypothetical protein
MLLWWLVPTYVTDAATRLVLQCEGLVHSLCLLDPVSIACNV